MTDTRQRSAGAQIGDLVLVAAHHVGEAQRTGEIREVLGEPPHVHYRVSWDDGRETLFYPSSDAIIRPSGRRARRPEER